TRHRSGRRRRRRWSLPARRREGPLALDQCTHRGASANRWGGRLHGQINRRICLPMLSWRATMIAGKDLLNQFKAASWKDPDEIDAFVDSAEAPQTPELLKIV